MGSGPMLPSSKWQSHLFSHCSKCLSYICEQERFASQRNKHVIIEGSVRASLLQVAFESGSSSLMQGNQPAFVKLGTADHQPVRCDVVVSQPDGLRNAKSRTGQQCEKRAVGLPAQSAVTRLRGQSDELADLLFGENIGSRSRPTLGAEDCGRYLMARVFCLQISSETRDVSQPS